MTQAIKSKRNSPLWYRIAQEEEQKNIREVPGGEHNPRILLYHSTTTLRAVSDEIPWCSAFVNWCVTRAGLPGTDSAAARSWMSWGDGLTTFKKGCIVVLSRGSNLSLGHVGFFAGRITQEPENFYLLGGNQEDRVCTRPFPFRRVVAIRWPTAEMLKFLKVEDSE